MKTIKEVLDYHFVNTKFDNQFGLKVINSLQRFLSKNDAHVEFFGSGLIGVHPIRWNYSDTDTWWDDIFEVEPEQLQQDLYKTKEIEKNRIVSSDALNQAFMYAIYRTHNSVDISDKIKEEVKVKLLITLNIKFLCSLAAHYFKYPSDEGIAFKAYNLLSKRFDLKFYGSWGKMIAARAESLLAPGALYYNVYTKYDNDRSIVKMINDIQGRIRDTYKEVTAKYYQVLNSEMKVLSSSSSVNLDGTTMLKDLERERTKYQRYIKNVISGKDGYIKEPLTEIVFQAIPSLSLTGPYNALQETLLDKYHDKKYQKYFDSMIDNLLTYSFDFIKSAGLQTNDLPGVMYRLKHNFMSGRITDETLLQARKDFIHLVMALDKKNKHVPLVPERCGVFLYLVLRTLTMNYYK